MIRINLLSEGRRPVIARKAKPKLSLGDQEPSLLFLTGGIARPAGGGHPVVGPLERDQRRRRQIRVAQREVEELRPILEEVAEFKAKQEELERKIEVVNELTLKQEGPVHILDKVSRALPDLLWLNQMNFRGRTVDLVGAAFNTNAVASFIENLDKVPEFREPEPGNFQASRNGTYDFRISFTFIQEQPEIEGGDI